MLNKNDIASSSTYQDLNNVIIASEYYSQNGAPDEILKLVVLENRKFGSVIEKLMKEKLCLKKPDSTQHDAKHEQSGKKIEIKSARYWAGGLNCKWQHLEPEYDYDVVIFVLIDFAEIKCWVQKKSVLIPHLTPQGKQGYWCTLDNLTRANAIIPVKSVSGFNRVMLDL